MIGAIRLLASGYVPAISTNQVTIFEKEAPSHSFYIHWIVKYQTGL